MEIYQQALKQILEQGQERSDRTGTGTLSLFGMQQRYDLRQGFPAVTTKELAFRSVVAELLWFLEGSDNERRLCEILHGTTDQSKDTIWTANALAPYWHNRAKFTGDLGRIYGVQWRSWRRPGTANYHLVDGDDSIYPDPRFHVDQISQLVASLKNDPQSRRHILMSWNPGEIEQMALPPCHCLAQFYVDNQNQLSCQMYQRSADYFLGVPFNIASYSLLTHMLAQVTGHQVGEFVHVVGDAHIYMDHVAQVQEILTREPRELPSLWLNPEVKILEKFTMKDIRLENYNPWPKITARMSV